MLDVLYNSVTTIYYLSVRVGVQKIKQKGGMPIKLNKNNKQKG